MLLFGRYGKQRLLLAMCRGGHVDERWQHNASRAQAAVRRLQIGRQRPAFPSTSVHSKSSLLTQVSKERFVTRVYRIDYLQSSRTYCCSAKFRTLKCTAERRSRPSSRLYLPTCGFGPILFATRTFTGSIWTVFPWTDWHVPLGADYTKGLSQSHRVSEQ